MSGKHMFVLNFVQLLNSVRCKAYNKIIICN
jgi:hypothetical protein